jgi:hypothetical protein
MEEEKREQVEKSTFCDHVTDVIVLLFYSYYSDIEYSLKISSDHQ